MYKIDKEIEELKDELLKTYTTWKKKYHFDKYSEDDNHLIVFYSDGEYDPSLIDVIESLVGFINK